MDLEYNGDSDLVEAIQTLSISNDVHNRNDAPNGSNADGDRGTPSTPTPMSNTTSTTILNPIYIPTVSGNDTWELTWPIWHMLPVQERKSIAKQNGFKSIGEFEESVILSRALNEDTATSSALSSIPESQSPSLAQSEGHQMLRPYSSDQLYELENRPQNYGLPMLAERSDIIPYDDQGEKKCENGNEDDFDLDSSSTDDNENDSDLLLDDSRNQLLQQQDEDTAPTARATDEEIEFGGLILLLPPDLVIHFILPFLQIEQYATCASVSPHWKSFTRTETVYKELCKRCYLQQSRRKTLHVHRFNHSYYNMLNTRYRVKTGCGFYVLKCTKIKKIQRDMWTEIPVGAILESTYYRYISFYEDGRLLYALTAKPPHEIIPIFQKMNIEKNTSGCSGVNTVIGRYEIQKDRVTVNVNHPWHHVRLVLRVLMDGYPGAKGRFWALEFEKHWSSKSGDFDEYWSRDLVEYKVPAEPIFRFLRDWRL